MNLCTPIALLYDEKSLDRTRQAPLDGQAVEEMLNILRDTLTEEHSRSFKSMDAEVASMLCPLIQFGKL
jgi:hypothetical protein